jgi:two-component system chemotaxis response regulator CheB
MRRLIKTALKADERLQVVFEARNGKDALENLECAKPDIIVMDVEMPVMDGIDATREIRKLNRSIPIIMFSSLTLRGAEATLDALAAGANDYVAKPTASGHINDALTKLKEELIPVITQLSRKKCTKPTFSGSRKSNAISSQNATKKRAVAKVDVIAIGVSTGGPAALASIFSALPKPFPIPILVTQHMPAVFTNLLANRLSAQSGHKVCEASGGEVVEPGRFFLAPGDYHLSVNKSGNQFHTNLDQGPPENSCRPAIDPFFRSIAKCYGKNAVGVVLTGMGQDGTRGAGEIKRQGGSILVQDQETSVVWGMPQKVVDAGFADQTLSLSAITQELIRMAEKARHTTSSCM